MAEGDTPAVELIGVDRRFLTPDGKSMLALRNFRNFSKNRPEMTNLNHQ